jgi:hypothetical protein
MAVDYVEQLSDFFRNIVNYRIKIIPFRRDQFNANLFLPATERYGDNLS